MPNGTDMKHRDACDAVARWFLDCKWCDFALAEVAGRKTAEMPPFEDSLPARPTVDYDVDAKAYKKAWANYQVECGRIRDAHERSHPECGGGVLDVLAITTSRGERQHAANMARWERLRDEAAATGRKFRRRLPVFRPRVAIAEIKVSRSDLRADLRKGKMRRYESQATHVYLAMPHKLYDEIELAALESMGLPPYWGLLSIVGRAVCVQRSPKAYPGACNPTADLRADLLLQGARSLAYRAL